MSVKEFAPSGNKFFPFRVDPFHKEGKTVTTEFPLLKVPGFTSNSNRIIKINFQTTSS